MALSVSCHLTNPTGALQTAAILFLSVMTHVASKSISMRHDHLRRTVISLLDLKDRINDTYVMMSSKTDLIPMDDEELNSAEKYARYFIKEDEIYHDLSLPKEFRAPMLITQGETQEKAITDLFTVLQQFVGEYHIALAKISTIEKERLRRVTGSSLVSCDANLASHQVLCDLDVVSHRLKSLEATVHNSVRKLGLEMTIPQSSVTSEIPADRELQDQYFVTALYLFKSQATMFYNAASVVDNL